MVVIIIVIILYFPHTIEYLVNIIFFFISELAAPSANDPVAGYMTLPEHVTAIADRRANRYRGEFLQKPNTVLTSGGFFE